MTVYSPHRVHNPHHNVRQNPDPPDYDMVKADGWGEKLELMDIAEIGLRMDAYPCEEYFAPFKKDTKKLEKES